MKPKKKKIDNIFNKEKKKISDKNLLLSKIIANNHQLRLRGDNDRALGIELLVEEFFSKSRIPVKTWDEIDRKKVAVDKSSELTKKVEILFMLFRIENLDSIELNKTLQSKN